MNRPAIFFDRDNTLIVADGYLGDASKVKLVDGAADAVARARAMGFAIVVFSNQSGVARGMFGEDDVRAVNEKLDELLIAQNEKAIVDRHEYCLDHPEASVTQYKRDNERRKPSPGMIHDAADELDLDLTKSWVIGDAPRDVDAGKAAGCRTILFTDTSLPRSPAANDEMKSAPDFSCATLKDAIDFIADPTAPAAKRTPMQLETKSKPDQSNAKVIALGEQILYELRRRNEPIADFSVTKLLAGIAQVISVAMVFLGYLYREDQYIFSAMLLFAIWLQTVTIGLLIMGRQHDPH